MGYALPMVDFECDIAIASIGALTLHEEVVSSHVESLCEAIEREGQVRDPVIVDRESQVVLDGMHRVTAIDRLGLASIPVCRVEYSDPSIELGGWLRVFDDLDIANVRERCSTAGLRLRAVDSPERSRRTWPAPPLLETPDGTFELAAPAASVETALDRAIEMLQELNASGTGPRLVPDTSPIDPATGQVTILIPPPDKHGVLAAAGSGDHFPPNTSRHVIPTRPMGVDAPLDLLDGDPARATRQLEDQLAGRSLDRLPPGSEYGGRTYEEELLVFR